MARHVLPLVLLVVALVVRLILSAPLHEPDRDMTQETHGPVHAVMVEQSIFGGLGPGPCPRRCHRRDLLGHCRLNFTCLFG
ncbi:uncharacterized protein LOC126998997 [Eriocheir sinensis]|uniref:uncharacterized protein LOC126998997 n=1 Tax=Eriocheir sinensis TaxID=95602 RepID=UPI0021C5B3A8|nr:uncharacterized protein LOC126998997 [Eriocheir sinensis]